MSRRTMFADRKPATQSKSQTELFREQEQQRRTDHAKQCRRLDVEAQAANKLEQKHGPNWDALDIDTQCKFITDNLDLFSAELWRRSQSPIVRESVLELLDRGYEV